MYILVVFSSQNTVKMHTYLMYAYCVVGSSMIKIGNNMVSVQSLSILVKCTCSKKYLRKNDSFECPLNFGHPSIYVTMLQHRLYIFDFMSVTIANIQWHNLLIVLPVNNKSPLQKAHDKNALELYTCQIIPTQQQQKNNNTKLIGWLSNGQFIFLKPTNPLKAI